MSFKCPACDYTHERLNSLRIHCAKSHKIPSEDLYVLLVLNGIKPTCECGCGESTKFHGLVVGYSKFAWGHGAKIHNNWGHNEAAVEKSLETRRKFGLWSTTGWSKGLTKDTDERLQKLSQTMSERHGERYSQIMRRNRLNGTIPNLYGPDNHNWKGGTSRISNMCHGNTRLYKEWKFPILKAAEFTCTRCPNSRNLHVHHDQERMFEIVNRFRSDYPEEDLTNEQKLECVERIVQYHITNNITGIVLCKDCHKLEHPSLNFETDD